MGWLLDDNHFYKLTMKLPYQWLKLSPGSTCEEQAPNKIQYMVKVKFQQGKRKLCLIKSLACALYYMDLHYEAGAINTKVRITNTYLCQMLIPWYRSICGILFPNLDNVLPMDTLSGVQEDIVQIREQYSTYASVPRYKHLA